MTPNFALGLTDDGITLWHRDAAGWLRVGAVPPDSADMDTRMRALVDKARALAPEGVLTKLVIPDDQILFCDLALHGATDARKREVLRGQMEGRTPYPVEDLIFDWVEQREGAHVAVVARETVQEAEDFAAGYGLNPVSAVAAPASARFAKEPFFCATRAASTLTDAPQNLSQHRDMVREAGTASLPAPPKPPAKPAPAAAPKQTVAAPADPPKAKPAQDNPPAAQGSADKTAAVLAQPASVQQPVAVSADAAGKGTAESAKTEAVKTEKSALTDKTQRNAALARKSALLGKLLAAGEARPTPNTTDSSPKPAFAGILQQRLRAASGAGDAPADAGPAEAPEPVAAFQSRRRPAADTSAPSAAPKAETGKTAAPAWSVFPAIQRQTQRGKVALSSLVGRATAKSTPSTSDAGDSAKSPAASPTPTPTPSANAAATSTLTQKILSKPERAASGNAWKPPVAPTQRRDPLTTLRDHGAARSEGESEAERLTIFGARNHTDTGSSGGQRALMILGGIALLLVAVAVWAIYLQTSRPAVVEVVEEAPAVAPLPSDITLPDPALQATSPLEDIEAALGVEDAAQQQPLAPGDLDTAESDIAAQPRPGTLELQTGRVAGTQSTALIAPVDAVRLPNAPPAPAPFGSEPLPPTRSEIGSTVADEQPLAAEPDLSQAVSDSVAEALAAAAPQSTLPAGEELLDIAVEPGQPSSVPPTRPEGLVSDAELEALRPAPAPEPEAAAPAPDPQPAAAPVDGPQQGAATTLPDESALEIVVTEGRPSAVPPARPEALAPETVPAQPTATPDPAPVTAPDADADDQASLATPPPGGVALTALRPAARPASLEATIEAAPTARDFANASALAVAASRKPGTRPSQFAAVVQRARSASAAQPASTPPQEPVQTASAAAAVPNIPTRASVAREATQTRAINLREVNLIGVMGTSSNRRALVRLSNGRVVTVRIGESLDGGQVTAIGDTELRYMRRGRDVVLRLAS